MVRRSKVRRDRNGIPENQYRCQAEVVDKDLLFPRQCYKVRVRGSAFCEIHRTRVPFESLGEKVALSYDDEVDAAARRLVESLGKLPT